MSDYHATLLLLAVAGGIAFIWAYVVPVLMMLALAGGAVWLVQRWRIGREYRRAEAELWQMPLLSPEESERYDRIYERYHGHRP